jgi:hypothetical protein
MSIAGPLGALPVGPAVATTVLQEDVNGGPLEALPTGQVAATTEVEENIDGEARGGGGCYQRVWQRPPLSLKKTSMVGLLGGTTGGSGSGHQ